MFIGNTILLMIGIIVILIGIAAIINPNIARIINAPGGPRIKAIVAIIAGLILLVVGFIFDLSTI